MMSLRRSVKRMVPFPVLTTYRSLRHRFAGRLPEHVRSPEVFSRIHAENLWGSGSLSGPGSVLGETEEIRRLLPSLVRRLGVGSLLDAPCGDFFWMQAVDLGDCHYIGVDVVPGLIEEDRLSHGGPRREFRLLDIRRDRLPQVDLILCRDCLIHLSFRDALATLANFKASGSTYLLATTNPAVDDNRPIVTGGFRNLNLCLPPFNLPEPLEYHRDRLQPPPGETLIDPFKHLGLWRLDDVRA